MRAFFQWSYRCAAVVLAGSNVERFPPVRWLNHRVTALLREPEAMVHGFRMRLDPADCMNLSILRIHEPDETALLERLIEPGWVVADVGANIGYFTLLFARAVGSVGKVIAFEPDPANIEILRHNVRANGYPQVTVVPAAVTDGRAACTLYRASDNTVDHRAYDTGDAREPVAVSGISLDQQFAGTERLDLVKIDVQGWEAQVVAGMRALFERNLPRNLLIEFWPQGLVAAGADPRTLLETLEHVGFTLRVCRRGAWIAVRISEVLARNTPESGTFVNIHCSRGDARI